MNQIIATQARLMQREREHTGALARISAQLEQLNVAIRADAPRVPRNEEHGLAGHDVGDLTIEQLTGTQICQAGFGKKKKKKSRDEKKRVVGQ